MKIWGDLIAVGSLVWTAAWSWVLFGESGLHPALQIMVTIPLVVCAFAVLPLSDPWKRRARLTATFVLGLWGVMLFAWMFLISAASMLASAAVTSEHDRQLTIKPGAAHHVGLVLLRALDVGS